MNGNQRRTIFFPHRTAYCTLCVTLLLACVSFQANATTITGKAWVLDGDTIKINNQYIRLHGIDAPESKQMCGSPTGEWACGKESKHSLIKAINRRTVVCTGETTGRYQRLIAICRVDGVDLNANQVRTGMAIAYRRYSKQYVNLEEQAKADKSGIWSGRFEAPYKFRKRTSTK